ncbi:hypothetical protein [Romboutsia sp. 1001713B170207_170306_H8]|uniref:hypothetical protein n=1 Tax=Romboutsia sp. 1001713B170207_170306_H8 TaxID=2787112 RepID=UPI00189A9BF6|nr:hypothetical protein [Romboutsia sp. 1001713B170207_170306_H8]
MLIDGVDFNSYELYEKINKRLNELQGEVFDLRNIATQLAISSGWTDDEVQNVIGASMYEIEGFRGVK